MSVKSKNFNIQPKIDFIKLLCFLNPIIFYATKNLDSNNSIYLLSANLSDHPYRLAINLFVHLIVNTF